EPLEMLIQSCAFPLAGDVGAKDVPSTLNVFIAAITACQNAVYGCPWEASPDRQVPERCRRIRMGPPLPR
ncbi:hypothetical protein M9458_025806, partial [Cirrhinus mrigala]